MKRITYFLFSGLLASSLIFIGCSEDAKKKEIEPSSGETTTSSEKPGVTNPGDPTSTMDPGATPANSRVANMAKTSIQFANYEHDFGQVMQDSENKYVFRFTNTGSEPLVIETAKGSCGCTVPEYPKEPIAPGGTGEIGVVYKPGKQKGQQNKNITITANTDPVQTIVKIKADVQVVGE
jgi:hypothetical protein